MDCAVRASFATFHLDDPQILANQGFGWLITDYASFFYADDDLLSSTDPVWLQDALDTMCDLCQQIGMKTNVTKTKYMLCLPKAEYTNISAKAYRHRITGEGFSHKERLKQQTRCPNCDKNLSVGSLPHHMRTQHGKEAPKPEPIDAGLILPTANPQTYKLIWPKLQKVCDCPVANCPGRF